MRDLRKIKQKMLQEEMKQQKEVAKIDVENLLNRSMLLDDNDWSKFHECIKADPSPSSILSVSSSDKLTKKIKSVCW